MPRDGPDRCYKSPGRAAPVWQDLALTGTIRSELGESRKARTTSVATSEQWVKAFARAAHDANPEVQAAWDSWNNTERRLMAVISNRAMPLQGREARERYGVSQTGSNQTTVRRLEHDGQVVVDESTATGWRVVDPLLELWLANGRRWPSKG